MSSSCWESITSALSPTSPRSREASLKEQLIARDAAAASDRVTVQRLRDRADALQRELDEVVGETEAAELATRHAERRELQAAAELDAAARTIERHEEQLRVLDKELKVKDGRIRVLEAIINTLTTTK